MRKDNLLNIETLILEYGNFTEHFTTLINSKSNSKKAYEDCDKSYKQLIITTDKLDLQTIMPNLYEDIISKGKKIKQYR